jgi:hypothetical protein
MLTFKTADAVNCSMVEMDRIEAGSLFQSLDAIVEKALLP